MASSDLSSSSLTDPATSAEVDRFRQFLRIPSISGEGLVNGGYKGAAEWLRMQCAEIGLSVETLEPVTGKPIILARLIGLDTSLPRIVLNSHYDVVPVIRDQWCCDPFAAELRDGYGDGPQVPAELRDAGPCVFGRGAQDMKCVCCQYLEALRRLLARGWKPRRTIVLSFVPDEEIGGTDGMAKMLQSSTFREEVLPIAFALDEGLANPGPLWTAFYGERTPWWLLIRAQGPTGHGSRFIQNTAVAKLMGVVNKALDFRKEQEESLGFGWATKRSASTTHPAGCKHSQAKKLGDVTTLNVTMLKGGVSVDGGKTYALNVIPTEAEAGFDVRISPTLATSSFKERLDEWCAEEGLSWSFAPWTTPFHGHFLTEADREASPFYGIFEDACATVQSLSSSEQGEEKKGMRVEREIFPAATDSRFLRELGIQAIGFSPMASTPVLLHEHNEALSVSTFMHGIKAYEAIIPALADAPPSADALTVTSESTSIHNAVVNQERVTGAASVSNEASYMRPQPPSDREAKRPKTTAGQ